VGDPFKEKLLLEACLELLATDAVAGIQDMGAAGLTCSTCETASRGGTGVEIDLAKVPKRETGMTPYEILLSESQERMLIIARKGQEEVVRRIFEKWDVPCAEIGRVTDDGMMRVLNDGVVAAEIPAKPLADEAPLYERAAKEPHTTATKELLEKLPLPTADFVRGSLRQLLRDPTIASKNWVYRQYDHMVRTGTVVRPGSDAAVFHVRAADKFIAATTDCNSLYCRLDPREGGLQRGWVEDVGGQHQRLTRETRGDRLEGLLVPRHERDPMTRGRQRPGTCRTDPLRGARDQRDAQRNAAMPVRSAPTESRCISSVPS